MRTGTEGHLPKPDDILMHGLGWQNGWLQVCASTDHLLQEARGCDNTNVPGTQDEDAGCASVAENITSTLHGHRCVS